MKGILLLALIGCGSATPRPGNPDQDTGSGSGSSEMVCNDVTGVGTLVGHQECHPVTRDQDAHDDTVRQMQRTNSMPRMGK